MAEMIVVICPTTQARTPAANWHDGQFAHAPGGDHRPPPAVREVAEERELALLR
jgi:hypothetical protein